MAKNNNLTDLLKSVADAIRAKKGTTDLINPQNFDAEIASIPSGGSGVKVFEGDIYLAQLQNYLMITHNLGVVPFLAIVELQDDFTPADGRIYYALTTYTDIIGLHPFGITYGQASIGQALPIPYGDNSNIYSSWFKSDVVRVYSGGSTRMFINGNYHFKIFYYDNN